jgi:ribosome biogenesis GTPase
MELTEYGWDAGWVRAFAPYAGDGYVPGRILAEHKERYMLGTAAGEMPAQVTGKYLYEANEGEDFPAVGDWVAARVYDGPEPQATLHALVPRRSAFRRNEASRRTQAQVVAANIDTALIVMGLDGNFNPRRAERYVALTWESGAAPAIVLTKADLCDDVAARSREIMACLPEVPVYAVSVPTGQGLKALAPCLVPGRTLVLLGSSGAGKSTLLNALLGEAVQRVQAVREADSRGRHTTTHRELFRLPGGALIIDTPGMRELQLWDADAGIAEAFRDIEGLATTCRYTDCTHTQEPGCAVQAALAAGTLDAGHYANYAKMRRELDYLAMRQDERGAQAQQRRLKQISKWVKDYQQHHDKRR